MTAGTESGRAIFGFHLEYSSLNWRSCLHYFSILKKPLWIFGRSTGRSMDVNILPFPVLTMPYSRLFASNRYGLTRGSRKHGNKWKLGTSITSIYKAYYYIRVLILWKLVCWTIIIWVMLGLLLYRLGQTHIGDTGSVLRNSSSYIRAETINN